MTRRDGNMVYIEEEKPQQCDFCGKIKELRPYGPRGEGICFDCMKLDEPAAQKQFEKLLRGES